MAVVVVGHLLRQDVPTGARRWADPYCRWMNLLPGSCELNGSVLERSGFGGVGKEVPVPEAATDIGPPVFGGLGAEVPVPEAATNIGPPAFGGVGATVPVPEAVTDAGPPPLDFGAFLLQRDVRPSKASGVGTLSSLGP